jgi:hypothetical protein
MGASSEGSVPDLSGHLQGLLDRAIAPDRFWSWFVRAEAAIERFGSDDDIELARLVQLRFFERTGGYIDDEELLEVLAIDREHEHRAALVRHQGVA